MAKKAPQTDPDGARNHGCWRHSGDRVGLLLYFGGHGFAFLGIILTLVGLMWVAWAGLGRDY